MNEGIGIEGISIRKTTKAFQADYKTRTRIEVMSDSEAKPGLMSLAPLLAIL